jgi:hypothetical protein
MLWQLHLLLWHFELYYLRKNYTVVIHPVLQVLLTLLVLLVLDIRLLVLGIFVILLNQMSYSFLLFFIFIIKNLGESHG